MLPCNPSPVLRICPLNIARVPVLSSYSPLTSSPRHPSLSPLSLCLPATGPSGAATPRCRRHGRRRDRAVDPGAGPCLGSERGGRRRRPPRRRRGRDDEARGGGQRAADSGPGGTGKGAWMSDKRQGQRLLSAQGPSLRISRKPLSAFCRAPHLTPPAPPTHTIPSQSNIRCARTPRHWPRCGMKTAT